MGGAINHSSNWRLTKVFFNNTAFDPQDVRTAFETYYNQGIKAPLTSFKNITQEDYDALLLLTQ